MSNIETIAIEFIKARRLKINAKAGRNNLLSRCELAEGGVYRLCVTADQRADWCEYCESAQPHHLEFKKRSLLAAAALRKLERAVNNEAP